jgi:hypothetical protein
MRWASQASPAAVTSNARRLGESDLILTINHAGGLDAGSFSTRNGIVMHATCVKARYRRPCLVVAKDGTSVILRR